MNDRHPSFLQGVTAAILRWADEQRRRAEDEKYWQAAQHDPRVMADITCALARSQAQGTAMPANRWTPTWSTMSQFMTGHRLAEH